MANVVARYGKYNDLFLSNLAKGGSEAANEARNRAISHEHKKYQKDVLPNIEQLTIETDALYQVFQDSHHKKDELSASGLVEILMFSNQLLLSHYENYQHSTSIELYKKRIQDLEHFAVTQTTTVTAKEAPLSARLDWIKKQAKDNTKSIWDLFAHPSALRQQFNDSNLTRIYWVFCHFCLNEIILIVKDQDIITKIGDLLGYSIDLDKFSDALNTPNNILNILSVVFFAGRLVVDLAMLAKHTYGANEDERSRSTAKQRFWAELDKRILSMTNCVVWGSVNLLTNYHDLFGIPAAMAMPIVAGVLIFDLTLLQVTRLKTKATYDKAIAKIDLELATKDLEPSYRTILEKQKQVLEDEWFKKNQNFMFNSIASIGLLVSFSLSLVITAPIAILACYLVGCICIAMYSSSKEYDAYISANRRHKFASSKNNLSQLDLLKLADDSDKALSNLKQVLLERAFAPLGLFILIGINPVLGFTASATYMAFKINNNFNKSKEAKSQGKALNQFSLFKDDKPADDLEDKNIEPELIDMTAAV